MKIAICDDDEMLCHQLEERILQLGKNEDILVQISVFFDGKSLWEYMKQGNRFDLMFLDIEMKQMNGIAVGQALRDSLGDEECRVVYISGMESYAMELFAVRPMDFVVKPVTQDKIKKIWDLYGKLYQRDQRMFHYPVNGSVNYIAFHRIRYFQLYNRKVEIHTTNGETLIFYGKISDVREQTDAGRFIQISRSELVNYNAIEEYRGDSVVLQGGEILPIVASRRKAAGQQISKYMGEMM